MTVLIDYDAGNLRSVEKALRRLGEEPVITREPEIILAADHVILPGVGAFRDCMDKLRAYGLVGVVKECAGKGTPFLGICLGMQLLFEASEEGMEENGGTPVEGLGLLPGVVRRIPAGEGRKIPHMGWNSLKIREGTRLFRDIPQDSDFYFVHSFCREAEGLPYEAAETAYGIRVLASVEQGNLFGTQFHPEKSSAMGLKLLGNFLGVRA